MFKKNALKCTKKIVRFFSPVPLKKNMSVVSQSKNLQDKFSEVYDKNLFMGSKSRSGEGSDHVQTEIIRREIPRIIREYNVKSFLDAPCGDWYWMSQTNLEVEKYIGVDIVKSMIDKNQQQFGSDTVSFKNVNLTTDTLPKADLIFSRDCLVHLNFKDALTILRNFKNSGAKYLLTTTFTNRDRNVDLIDEHGNELFWRPLNMQLGPFNFPEPILFVNEGCTEDNNNYKDKCLGLWLLTDLTL